jgi:hypothetical protein
MIFPTIFNQVYVSSLMTGVLYRVIDNHQDCQILQNDLDYLSSWADCWQLKFNVSKCYHLGITSKRTPHMYNYCLNGQIICRESSTKYLGVTITSTLRWNEHCDNICKKANSTLGLLKRILGSCSPTVKTRAYLSLVRPKLEYASCINFIFPKNHCNWISTVLKVLH